MDNLFRQTRLRFSGAGQEKKEEPESSKDRRIPTQKSQSLKDKKKEPNWFQKQITWQMSQDHDSSNGDERAVAVAAATYAINSLQELGTSTVPIKSKKEDPTILTPQHGRVSKKFSGETAQISDNPDAATETEKAEKELLLPSRSSRKTPSSLDTLLSGSFKYESGTPKPDSPTDAITPAPPSVDKRSGSFRRGSSASKPDEPTTMAEMGKSQADIWEEDELGKLTQRYEARKSTILTWEARKKAKAKRRQNKAERRLERKREKALAKYRSETRSIEQVSKGAKAKAEEKRRNDELKAKEKAKTIRTTGKVPSSTCWCF